MTDPLKPKPTRTFADIARGIAELAEARKRTGPKPVPPQDAPPPPPSHHDSEESKP